MTAVDPSLAIFIPVLAPTVCLLVGVLIGLRAKHRRYLAVRQDLREERARIDMWNKAGANTLLDEVGPATPRSVQYDQDAEIRSLTATISGPRDQVVAAAEVIDGLIASDTHQFVGLCEWSVDGTTDCGDPAEGWAYLPTGEPVWLCAVHFQWACHDAVDPLPHGQVSD